MTDQCRAFEWVGQSLETCDGCGNPAHEHRWYAGSKGGPLGSETVNLSWPEAVACTPILELSMNMGAFFEAHIEWLRETFTDWPKRNQA